MKKELAFDVFKEDSKSFSRYCVKDIETPESLQLYEKVDPEYFYKYFRKYIAKALNIEFLRNCSIELKGYTPCIQYGNMTIQFYVA